MGEHGNVVTQASAYSPAGISSFFRIHGPMENPTGATGGGFTITRGVRTTVTVKTSPIRRVTVSYNGVPARAGGAVASLRVAGVLLERAFHTPVEVSVEHIIDPPVAAGFGTSAASALSLALALSEALGLKLTLREAAEIAHTAEVESRTGLGTVAALTVGGCVVTFKPGPPGECRILRIPLHPDLRIVAAYFRSKPTNMILKERGLERRVNRFGDEALRRVLSDPRAETLLSASRDFAVKTGFATGRVIRALEVAEAAGALGGAQNMLGEAIHVVAYRDDVNHIIEALTEKVKPKRILASSIGGKPQILEPITGRAISLTRTR
ncbi:MAG: hypothetical protein ACP5QI_00880 [Candidatus Bathyarchaeia archaeon]